jgi:acyl-CoA thioester hydrolase
MDAMQHVNNIVYFRYIESARMAYFERIGFLDQMRGNGIGPILAWTSCRFRRPLTYPDKVAVGTRVAKIEADRFTMDTLIVSQATGAVAAESEGIVVSYDYRQQQKAALPREIRENIERLEETCRKG